MRRVACCIAIFLTLAAPRAAFGDYDFQLDPQPTDFTFSRESDPGGGWDTYVVDHLRATFAIPAVPVAADTYHFHFDFPADAQPEFSAGVERIDVMASLGDLQTYFGVGSSAGRNLATLGLDVENLTLTGVTGNTVTFYQAGSSTEAIGVGIDMAIDVRGAAVTPGDPFRLRSLDVTFRIPSQYVPSDVPDSPAKTVVLDLGAGANVRSADVSNLEPLVRIVPEPGAAAFAL